MRKRQCPDHSWLLRAKRFASQSVSVFSVPQSSQGIPNFKFACPQFFTRSRIFHNRKFFAFSSLSSRSSRLNREQNSYNSAWSEHEILDMHRLEFLRGKQCSFNRMTVSLSLPTMIQVSLQNTKLYDKLRFLFYIGSRLCQYSSPKLTMHFLINR
jgi:hypothetical protein